MPAMCARPYLTPKKSVESTTTVGMVLRRQERQERRDQRQVEEGCGAAGCQGKRARAQRGVERRAEREDSAWPVTPVVTGGTEWANLQCV